MNEKNSLQAFQAKYLPQLEEQMLNKLETYASHKVLKEAMQYSVEAGGKRIRPLLVLLVCQAGGRPIEQNALQVAGSLEFMHTYSLIHDDLPEMDNDDLRRGKPTNHKVFGQDIAVLAGDALLTESLGWLTETTLLPETKVTLINALAKAAGANGMVAGQAGDILGEKQKLTLEQLIKVHQNKTGRLLEYACFAGGILANGTSRACAILADFGAEFGLAFQIYDDILDVTATTAELGKAVHKDQDHNKNTYPLILGLDKAKIALITLVSELESKLEELASEGFETSLLRQLLDYFKIRK